MGPAMASVVLNLSEGSGSQVGICRARYFTALGGAREVRATLRVAVALGYVAQIDVALEDQLDYVCAVLWRLTR